MARGKETCKILKEIRRQIAEANDIELITSECKYQGDCAGTCPKCEAEVRYLEEQLSERRKAGKVVQIAGISAAAVSMIAPLSVQSQSEELSCLEGDITQSVLDEEFLVKGKVLDASDSTSIEPLIGVLIKNSRTKKQAVSDMDGNFSINAAVGDMLNFSYIGFSSVDIPVQNAEPLEVKLKQALAPMPGEAIILGGIMPAPAEEKGMLDFSVVDENDIPVPLDDVCIEHIIEDKSGVEFADTLQGRLLYDRQLIRFDASATFRESTGRPLKKMKLRISAEGFAKTKTITVHYPSDNKPLIVKLRRHKRWLW